MPNHYYSQNQTIYQSRNTSSQTTSASRISGTSLVTLMNNISTYLDNSLVPGVTTPTLITVATNIVNALSNAIDYQPDCPTCGETTTPAEVTTIVSNLQNVLQTLNKLTTDISNVNNEVSNITDEVLNITDEVSNIKIEECPTSPNPPSTIPECQACPEYPILNEENLNTLVTILRNIMTVLNDMINTLSSINQNDISAISNTILSLSSLTTGTTIQEMTIVTNDVINSLNQVIDNLNQKTYTLINTNIAEIQVLATAIANLTQSTQS